ncbi:hypothetical protein NDU88_000815 [Pleurodeles waltl]|uniref:Uncharacterized protein n=1 Tax=Pleurodeles waltl TaxID=8319 RepID=A0AAV7VZ99_PLEWA|nr:hypothetical protein NDU88_000815 [Pleurodeles waltl]
MGRRGGSGSGPQERQETAPLIVPTMWDQETVQVPTYQEDKQDKILEAIKATGQDMKNRVDVVAIEVTLLREDQKKLSERVTSTEIDLKVLRLLLTTMEKTVRFLADKRRRNDTEENALKTPLQCNTSRVYLFPDYTVTDQRQQASFAGVKKRLRQVGLTYFFLFPARLKILANWVSFFFTEPTAAWDWVEQWRNETPVETSPTVQSDRSKRKKLAETSMQGTIADRRLRRGWSRDKLHHRQLHCGMKMDRPHNSPPVDDKLTLNLKPLSARLYLKFCQR